MEVMTSKSPVRQGVVTRVVLMLMPLTIYEHCGSEPRGLCESDS